jgi:hypothetical protein
MQDQKITLRLCLPIPYLRPLSTIPFQLLGLKPPYHLFPPIPATPVTLFTLWYLGWLLYTVGDWEEFTGKFSKITAVETSRGCCSDSRGHADHGGSLGLFREALC